MRTFFSLLILITVVIASTDNYFDSKTYLVDTYSSNDNSMGIIAYQKKQNRKENIKFNSLSYKASDSKLIAKGKFAPNSHLSFFIDADNNPNTGYRGTNKEIKGADYLIEDSHGGTIYKYPKNTTGWHWNKIGSTPFQKGEKKASTKIPHKLIHLGNVFKILASAATYDWKNTTYSMAKVIKVKRRDNIKINTLKFSETDSNYLFKIDGSFPVGNHYEVYIDLDNDKNTGYSKNNIPGADYLIEDGLVYRYPEGAHNWKWEKIGKVVNTDKNNNEILVEVSKNLIPLEETFRFMASVSLKDWKNKVYSEIVKIDLVNRKTITYTEDNEIFKNPERGLYALRYMSDVPYRNTHTEPSHLNWISSGPYTTFRLDLVLAGSRNSPIPQSYIDKVKKQFEYIRQAGLKTILRVTYNEHLGDEDADIDRVLNHIRQLKPILEENKDVIMAIGAGYIGAWGEWHHSTHNLTTAENSRKIKDTLMQNVPKEIKIMFRRPSFLMSWYPTALTEDEANKEIDKSRAGFHDDCFAWNNTDMGTFSRDVDTRDEQFRYLEQSTKYTSVVGEMCTADVENEPNTVSCESGLDMAKRFHYSLLGDQIRGDWTRQDKLPVEVYQEEGCWEEFQKKLGYRFVLESATIPNNVQKGKNLNIALKLINRGFSATVNERPVYLVLYNDNKEYKFKIDTDPRKWYGGEEITLKFNQKLPNSIEVGNYTLYLWLPDKSPKLQNDKRYAIRFANENVWDEEKGYNKLGMVSITQ